MLGRAPLRIHQVPFTRAWTSDPHPGTHVADPVPAALVVSDGEWDAEPYRQVTVVNGRLGRAMDAEHALVVARRLLAPGAEHVFSHLERGGDGYVGVFDGLPAEVAVRDELHAWLAVARSKKRPAP